MPDDVSVVICTNREERLEDLKRAVRSIGGQSVPAYEVIVVVDHNPSLLDTVRMKLPIIEAIDNNKSRGLGGARNSGLARATGTIVAFLDDDAVAAPDWVEQMTATYADSQVVGVGGAAEAMFEGRRARWFPSEFNWVVGCSYEGQPKSASAVRNLMGCNMSFRREVFQEVGEFRLGYGCDETEFCIRVGQRFPDAHLVHNPNVKVGHRVPGTRMSLRYFLSRCYFEGGSKAVVSWLVGAQDGLSSERSYTLRTLPRGVLRGIEDALVGRDFSGLARASAICLGLAATTAGYLRAQHSTTAAARRRGWTDLAIQS